MAVKAAKGKKGGKTEAKSPNDGGDPKKKKKK